MGKAARVEGDKDGLCPDEENGILVGSDDGKIVGTLVYV